MKQLIVCLLLFTAAFAKAQNIPPPPSPPRLVNDFANLLTPDQRAHLEQKLVAFDDSTSIQVVVVSVTTLDDYAPVDYAVKLGREWKVGNKKTNNGVVLLISTEPGNRKVFIAPGYGLEGAIPDITAQSIIDNEIVPQFKQENYFRGINNGVDAIIKASAGEYKAPEGYRDRGGKGKGGGGGLVFIIILIVVFLILRGGGGSGRGPRGGMMSRRGYWPFLFFPTGGGRSSGSGWSGGGGGFGGGGGGGFGGFGGGSFGGGGAGGSW